MKFDNDLRVCKYNICLSDDIDMINLQTICDELKGNCWMNNRGGEVVVMNVNNYFPKFQLLVNNLRQTTDYLHIYIRTDSFGWVDKNILTFCSNNNVQFILDLYDVIKLPKKFVDILYKINIHITKSNVNKLSEICTMVSKLNLVRYEFMLEDLLNGIILEQQLKTLFNYYYKMFQTDTSYNICTNVDKALFALLLNSSDEEFRTTFNLDKLREQFDKEIKSQVTITTDNKVFLGDWCNAKEIPQELYICEVSPFNIIIQGRYAIKKSLKKYFDDIELNKCDDCVFKSGCTRGNFEENIIRNNSANTPTDTYCQLSQIIFELTTEMVKKLDEEKCDYFRDYFFFRFDNDFK